MTSSGQCKLNPIGEFSDPALEKEFRQREQRTRLRTSRYVILAGSVLYFLLSFAESSSLKLDDAMLIDFLPRFSVMFLAALMTVAGIMLRSYILDSILLTVVCFAAACNYLVVLYMADYRDFSMMCMCVMVCIAVFSSIPNRWINILVFSESAAVLFVVLADRYMEAGHGERGTGTVCVLLTAAFVSFTSFQLNVSRRRQYAWETEQQRSAMIDPLTGAGNRAKFDTDLNEALLLAQRDVPFCLVMLNLDQLDQIKERTGEGDHIIEGFAKLISRNIRGYESFSRWDDDTFCLLTPHTVMEDAVVLAQRLCKVTAMNDFGRFGQDIHVTCCVGVVSNHANDTAASMQERAASCTAQARRLGSNMVVTEAELD